MHINNFLCILGKYMFYYNNLGKNFRMVPGRDLSQKHGHILNILKVNAYIHGVNIYEYADIIYLHHKRIYMSMVYKSHLVYTFKYKYKFI